MNYELRHFDTPLLRFAASENTSSPEIEILWENREKIFLLPLDMQPVSNTSLQKWLKRRTVPKNRAYVHNFLNKCGLSLNRPMNLIQVSKGLSLNDCYWVVEEGFTGTFDMFNLYDNRFSRTLALIAFTGYGSDIRSSLISSPEFTTNGMLPKCWRRIDGKIILFKGGTFGASNTGNEPYSEYYAAQIAKKLGIDAVDYGLAQWKNCLCSTCELFTGKQYGFIPVGHIVTSGGMDAVKAYYRQLGPMFEKALGDMFLLDAIICNTDRHFGNFGFLIDNETNRIVAPAPLFDHGNSLFNFAGNEGFASESALEKYAATLYPAVYDDFTGTAKASLTHEHREKLRSLLHFRFRRNSKHNLPAERLAMMERVIQKRIQMLLA
ncbi:MAG: XRE family transcriptional regulator [Oscillospiraceae bacterium]|jgi:hypothetical protein|nr:XRE family transcriptional regulator [Oscillospiraceae bacterium]